MNLLRRLWYLGRGRRADDDLAEEMEYHRAMAQTRLEQDGLSPREAADASRRLMGNVTLAREDARAERIAPWLDGIWQDAVYALRMLGRAPAFTGALALVMAMGIGATTAVFTLVDGLVLKDLPVPAADRLVYFSSPSFSYPVFGEVRARSGAVLDSVAAWSVEDMHVAWARELEPTPVLTASGGFYQTLGVTAAIGRVFSESDDRIGGGSEGRVAIISDAAWRRRYGADPSVIGRTLRVGPDTYTIVGVTPKGFFGVAPGMSPDITIPLTSNREPRHLLSASSSWVHMIGRLRDGVTLSQANAALSQFWPAALEATAPKSLDRERRAAFLARSTSLESARAGFSRVRNRFAQPLWFLFALVGLLLVVAGSSAANLLLARGAGRGREIAVRLAIGAGRARLIRQMLTESLVWTSIAAIAGLLLASWGATSLVALMTTRDQKIDLDAGINVRVLVFSIVVAAITSAICSVVPAFRSTRIHPASELKTAPGTGGAITTRWGSGRWIVAAQVAVSVLLLGSAALFARSLYQVVSQNAGVDRRNVLVLAADVETAGYDDDRAVRFYQDLIARIRRVPGVESAGISMYPPLSGGDGAWSERVALEGGPGSEPVVVYFNTVSPGYFETTGMTLLRGRDVREDDHRAAPPVAVVNETLARRFFPGQDPLGRRLAIGRGKDRRDLEIVGLVSDSKYQRLQETPRAIAFAPWLQQRGGNMFIEVRAAGGAAVGEAIRSEVRALDTVVPVNVQTVAERIRESLVTERVLASLAGVLAAAAAALACAGLYGLLAYGVSRRAREIGVRLALGAERRSIVLGVFTESLVLVSIGVAVGVGAALASGRVIRGLLFEITPADPLSIAAAAFAMFAIAGLAGLGPAWRAARVDPVNALKSE